MAFSLSKMTLFSSDEGNAFPWKTFMYTPKQNSFLKSPQPIVGRLVFANETHARMHGLVLGIGMVNT